MPDSTLRTAPSVQHAVVAQRTLGRSKRSIARSLGIARGTVDAILAQSQTSPDYTGRAQAIVPKALNTIEKQIERGDGNLAMRFVEYALPVGPTSVNIQGDATFQTLVQLAPAAAAKPVPVLAVTQPSADPSAPTEAAANHPQGEIELENRTKFLDSGPDGKENE